ncbi:MAG: replicative DNA helicase [Treponema sp.]|jgi:replicative DNA helicase|nr:replicative DNA helicase [Treponema sp.]
MADRIKDKTPPHDSELEQAALGSLLSDNEAVSAAIQLHLRPEFFYSRAHMRIFEAILNLDGQGLRADIQTVVQELKKMGKLDEAGGASYVSSLTTLIPSSANIEYYAQTVKDYSLKRSLLKISSEIAINSYDETKEANEVLDDVQKSIFKLSDERYIFSSRKIGDVLKETIDLITEVMRSKNPITGIPTGFEKLDQMTSGFQRDEFIIVGARPSVGKTAIMLNMASHISIRHKMPCAFFSLEMSDIALVQRIISAEANVQHHGIRSGFLSTGDYTNIVKAMDSLYEAPLHFVDIPNMKLSDLRSQARKLRAQNDIKIIFIDYLGLIEHEKNYLQRFDKFSDISRALKSLARELHIPVVVGCQLNRDAHGETPTLANLRDSGSIEQDADLVLFLHRGAGKGKGKNKDDPPAPTDGIPTDLIVAKQRNGPTGVVNLELKTKYGKFDALSRDYDINDSSHK